MAKPSSAGMGPSMGLVRKQNLTNPIDVPAGSGLHHPYSRDRPAKKESASSWCSKKIRMSVNRSFWSVSTTYT
jgi:hypothetical protein